MTYRFLLSRALVRDYPKPRLRGQAVTQVPALDVLALLHTQHRHVIHDCPRPTSSALLGEMLRLLPTQKKEPRPAKPYGRGRALGSSVSRWVFCVGAASVERALGSTPYSNTG